MEKINLRPKGVPENSNRSDKILQLVVKIDKIHKENDGKMTIDEIKLRIEVRINLKLWSIENTFKSLWEKVYRFFKVFREEKQ